MLTTNLVQKAFVTGLTAVKVLQNELLYLMLAVIFSCFMNAFCLHHLSVISARSGKPPWCSYAARPKEKLEAIKLIK